METKIINDGATDMEVALMWAGHIRNLCTVMVDGEEKNIKDFYLNESKNTVLPKLTNPFAKRFLQIKIEKYS